MSFDVRDGLITQVQVMLNPDKLVFVRRQLGQP